MPTNSKQNTPNQEEINILYLFEKIGEFLWKSMRGFINLIGTLLAYLLRKWYYLAIAAILTIVSGLILNATLDSYYDSDLVLRTNSTQSQAIMSYLDKLGEYADEYNYSALSNKLDLSIEDASAIKGIQTYRYYDIGGDGIFDGIDFDRRFLADTTVVTVDSIIVVSAQVYNPDIFKKLEEGFVFYMESNPFLKASNKQRLARLETLLNQTQYEIEKLDSLQKKEYYTKTDETRLKEGQFVFSTEKSVRLYHREMFEMLELKQEYERDLIIYSDIITVLEEFRVPMESKNGTIYYSAKLIWFYLGLALLISVIVTFRKKIWDK